KVVSRRSPDPATYPFQKVFFDLITHDPAYNGDHFILHFIDSYSNLHKVYTFPDKGAINTAIIYFVNWVKNTFKLNIQVLQTDGAKANNNITIHVLRSMGITRQRTAPYTPDQLGKAEEAGGVLSTRSRSLHLASKLPWKLRRGEGIWTVLTTPPQLLQP